jgi:tetratricopeptide (TPR) repeat protein
MSVDELVAALQAACGSKSWEVAIGLGERALALEPSNADVRRGTADAYNERAVTAIDQSDYAQALKDLNRSVALNPDDAASRYNRGLTWHHLQDQRRAIQDLAQAIALDAGSFNSYALRAECHRVLSNHHEALADYRRAMEIDPDTRDVDMLTGRALTLVELHRAAEAIDDLTRVLDIEPTAEACHLRGICYVDDGEYTLAALDCIRAIASYPADASFYRTLSVAFREGGEPGRAVIECNRAIGLQPRTSENYWSRALALTAMGREDEAQIDRYQAAMMEIEPDRAMDIFDRAWTLAQAEGRVPPPRAVAAPEGEGSHPVLRLEQEAEELYEGSRFAEAVSACRSIVATGSGTVEAYGILAASLAAVGDVGGGIAEMERTLLLEPSYTWLHAEMGRHLLRHGNANEAVQAFAAAMREPRPHYALGLGLALDTAGFPDDAQLHLERAATAGAIAPGPFERGALREPRQFRGVIPGVELTIRPSPRRLSDSERWILATAALLTEGNSGRHDCLGMWPVDHIGRERGAANLGRHWSIRNRDEALDRLDWLENVGDSARYAQARAVTALDAVEREARVGASPRARAGVAFAEAHQAELGNRDLRAFDLGRVVAIAGWCALAGYITEAEAWDLGLRAAQRLQSLYGSWRELGRHYLLGRLFALGEISTKSEQSYTRLLSESDSPWAQLAWDTPLHASPARRDAATVSAVAAADGPKPLAETHVAAAERAVGLHLPPVLRAHFLRTNGGRPHLNVYRDERDEGVTAVVSEWLPLLAEGETAVVVYMDHVHRKKVVPAHFFPFALEPSGDYFYVDCSSAEGLVHLHRHDTAFVAVVAFNVGLDVFLSRLRPGGECPPEGYVFHYLHDYDPTKGKGTIQIVQAAAHRRTSPHLGGIEQYERAHGRRYKG